jgi:hypothetical protein
MLVAEVQISKKADKGGEIGCFSGFGRDGAKERTMAMMAECRK